MPDPFAVLDVFPRFDLDEAELQRRYLELTAKHHPDRFTDPLEQTEAAEKTAEVNEAYRLLRDPEQRANALLLRLGGRSAAEDQQLPPDLLMEVMELRESLETAQAEKDHEAMRRLVGEAQERRQRLLDALAEKFTRAVERADDPSQPDLLAEIRRDLNTLRYFQRMVDQAPDVQRE